MLVVRQIDFGWRLLVEAAVFDVSDDADDRFRPVAHMARELRGDPNLSSNGIEACEKPLCRSLVDQGDLRRCRRVTSVEETSRADRNPHRPEVVRADDPHGRRWHRCRFGLGLVLATEPGYDIEIARERQPECDGRGFHARFRLQAREERRHERVEVRGSRILRRRKR